jgi:hypothetical protein
MTLTKPPTSQPVPGFYAGSSHFRPMTQSGPCGLVQEGRSHMIGIIRP